MRVHLDCFPCFLKQTVIAARLGTEDEAIQVNILKGVLDEIKATDMSQPPAYSTTFLHRKMRQLLGKDPYKEVKSKYNQIALELYPEFKEKVEKSHDPLWTATRLAIAGNIIDFGIFTAVDIVGTIDRALNNSIAIDEYLSFRDAVNKNSEVLYLLDNAGEIVFDRLLIEVLSSMGKKVRAVAKGHPVLNDSTMEDAIEVGLTNICEVFDNGSDCIGTILELTSPEFVQEFIASRFIISKGQGNFETLCSFTPVREGSLHGVPQIFFLLQSKCSVVAREFGIAKDSMLLTSNYRK
ncbi:ARMT1-like domain-containing protein [Thermodesulfovibrionales bacterium]|nr:ARMT1-like domain-containing protein [Thermodesulfovibrionales bacterium]MCL0042595.1 ARMT1-like domain-containing protein [Thermodesulfovibrionales bacterium]MCL0083748.1 ARMT1-like domain-containing protein [Thermodesulfovibrionales bacterium]MCL0085474.1 ARMT1-like domain-containing protein [Thermodesulfovibrionales bacterium]MCL0087044.1 ARMT1-like domain-containing protein [Thermodesulfovibrionales bacterium]